MKNSLRKNLVTILTLVLFVCMLFSSVGVLGRVVSFADTTTTAAMQVEGASVRVTDEASSGIRFRARLNKAEYDGLYSQYDGKVKAGMIIVPTDYIEKAGGHTFSAFAAANLPVSAGGVDEFKKVTVAETEYYEFAISLINIKDGNYVRDFEGIVYIEVESDSTVAGFEFYGGKYYAYGARNEEYARNIYSVANLTYNDRVEAEDADHPHEVDGKWLSVDETGLGIVKSYVDGVADLKFDTANSKIAVANNSDYYTSPFEDAIYLAENGDAYVYNAKSVLYNGKKVTEKYSDGANGVAVYKAQSLGATVNADNTITLKNVDYVNRTKAYFDEKENSYVSAKGQYGIGTKVSIKGRGGNLPYIMFGVDNINGWMTEKGGSGLLIVGGNITKTAKDEGSLLSIYGPNRTEVTNWTAAKATQVPINDTTTIFNVGSKGYFNNNRLNSSCANLIWTITYTLELDETDGTLVVALTFDGDNTGINGTIDTGLVWEEDISAGSIVAFAALYGQTIDGVWTPYDTTFSWEITDNSSKGATFNEDGTVTLKNVNYTNMTKAYFTGTENSYVSAQGKYGVGTDVTLEFTGGNVPNVILFADKINGNMTSDGGKGILIMPGNIQKTSSRNQAFRIYGPNRMSGSNVDADTGLTFTNATSEYNKNYYLLSRFNQSSTVNFKWVITTTLTETNTVTLIFKLYENGTLVNTSTFATALIYGTDVSAGSIIILAGVNGTGTGDSFVPYDTTFKCTIDDNLSNGATFNDDGTITLTNVDYVNRTKAYFDQKENSYVAKQGKYGIGTVVTVSGVGANIPILGFCIDNINGSMTSNGGKGLLFVGGNVTKTAAYEAQKVLMFGPNRTSSSNWTASEINYTAASATQTPYTIGWQANNASTSAWTMTYTLALDSSDNTLVIDVTYAGVQNFSNSFDTGLVWETDISAGSVVAYAAVYGKTIDSVWTPIDTTFSWKVTAGA